VDGLRTYCGQVREGALRVCDPAPAPIAAYSCEQVGAFGWSRTYLAGRSL